MSNERERIGSKLMDNGVSVFTPLGLNSDIDFAIRTGDGTYIEVIVRNHKPENGHSFQMNRFRPRPHLFIICITSKEEHWIIPSTVFERFASGAPVEASWVLNLDASNPNNQLPERLSVYQERWSLLSNYTSFKSTLNDPVALKVRIAMG